MTKSRSTFGWILVCLGLSVSAAPGSAQTGRIEGIVTHVRDKQPVDDARISIARPADGVVIDSVVADDGEFAFEVDAGAYVLSIEAEGFRGDIRPATVAAGDTTRIGLQLFRTDRLLSSQFFEPNEPNYFLFGPDGRSDEPGYHNQVKFRIAVRYALVSLGEIEGQSGLYAVYTQDSFWHLYNESAPFYDNNYAPEGLAYLDSRDYAGKRWSRVMPSIRGYFRHQSNGRDGPDSRSWNRAGVGFEWGNTANRVQHISVNFWGVVSDAPENRDIRQTNGSGEVRVDLAPFIRSGWGLDRFGISARSRIFGTRVFENLELNGYLRIPYNPGWFEAPPSLTVQGFCGRGEVLLDRRDRGCVLRAGVAVIR